MDYQRHLKSFELLANGFGRGEVFGLEATVEFGTADLDNRVAPETGGGGGGTGADMEACPVDAEGDTAARVLSVGPGGGGGGGGVD